MRVCRPYWCVDLTSVLTVRCRPDALHRCLLQRVASEDGGLKLTHFQRIKQLGSGDVGMVDLVRLRDTEHVFAMKTLDKREMVERNKVALMLLLPFIGASGDSF